MHHILGALAYIIDLVLTGYMIVVIVSALITWVNPDPYNPVVRILRALTEPVFNRLRRALPFLYQSGIDFTPMVVILILIFLNRVIPALLVDLAVAVAT